MFVSWQLRLHLTKSEAKVMQYEDKFSSVAATMSTYGSRTRSAAWNEVAKNPDNKTELELPGIREYHDSRRRVDCAALCQKIGSLSPEHSSNPYSTVASFLQNYFSDETSYGPIHVIDTHSKRFLDDMAPDISVQRNASLPDKFNLTIAIDIKTSNYGTSTNRGQMLDYLQSMANHQPGRTVFFGIITDMVTAEVIRWERLVKGRNRRTSVGNYDGHSFRCRHYRNSSLEHSLAYIHGELNVAGANPLILPFSPEAGDLNRIIQLNDRSIIAQFVHKKHENCIVKAAATTRFVPDIRKEIEFLKLLQEPGSDRPCSIPTLLFSFPDLARPQMGIHPYGTSFRLEAFTKTCDLRGCLMDILHALAWVHAHGLVHRDVRADNVILAHENRLHSEPTGRKIWAVLIDFDRAAPIGVSTIYEGGYICCPENLLRNMSDGVSSSLDHYQYTPKPSHDYLAFVLLVNHLLFPFTFQRYQYHRVEDWRSPEAARLFNLWVAMRASATWSRMIQCAEKEEDYPMQPDWNLREWTQWEEALDMMVLL